SFTHSCATANCTDPAITHSLGVKPTAVIMWTNGKTNSSVTAHYMWSYGLYDAATTRFDNAASQNGVGTNSGAQASRREGNTALVQVLQGTTGSGTVLAEAVLNSWSTTDFAVRWPTNNGVAYVVHYLLIGGSAGSEQVL